MNTITSLLQEARLLSHSYLPGDVDKQERLLREVVARTDSLDELILTLLYTHEGGVEKEAFQRACQLAQTPAEQEKLIRFLRTEYLGELIEDEIDEYWWAFQEKAVKDPSILSDPLVLVKVLSFELVEPDMDDRDVVSDIEKLFSHADQLIFSPVGEPFSRLVELSEKWKSMKKEDRSED